MIAGIIPPAGSLGALSPHQVLVSPIAAVDVAVGDCVQFDLASSNATYTSAANLQNYDENTCPFNVVIKSVAGTDGGVFGIVTTAAAAGNRCVVCVAGVVDAKFNATLATVGTICTAGTANLVIAVSGTGAPVAMTLIATTSSGTYPCLFNGFVLGSSAA